MNWRCENCQGLITGDVVPTDYPECDYFHCGDLDCCTGEGFIAVTMPNEDEDEETRPGKIKNCVASPSTEDTSKRCQSCDGTGDLHSADGQWLGACPCRGEEIS